MKTLQSLKHRWKGRGWAEPWMPQRRRRRRRGEAGKMADVPPAGACPLRTHSFTAVGEWAGRTRKTDCHKEALGRGRRRDVAVVAETDAGGGGGEGGEDATQAGGGRGIPAPNPPVHRRDVFIKQTYVHIARYGEGRGVRMGAAVAAETEAGGGGEEGGGAPAARRGASPRLPPPPWRQGRGGREQAARTFTVFTQVKDERARTEKANRQLARGPGQSVAISLAISPRTSYPTGKECVPFLTST